MKAAVAWKTHLSTILPNCALGSMGKAPNAQVDTFRESGLLRQFLFVASMVKLENTLLILDATNMESISNTMYNV
jgi:hypothetical protein